MALKKDTKKTTDKVSAESVKKSVISLFLMYPEISKMHGINAQAVEKNLEHKHAAISVRGALEFFIEKQCLTYQMGVNTYYLTEYGQDKGLSLC